jgi:predicted AAA+ superfamily ATPase
MIQRFVYQDIIFSLENFPVTAILGPRQCGKSTLAKQITSQKDSIYLDLEKPSDLAKLENPEWFFNANKDKLICLDEIQRMPDLFPLIRSLVDDWGKNGSFLILGSASRDLLLQSSETLAGRIHYIYLQPFLWDELTSIITLEKYIEKGGFPRSILTESNKASTEWRKSFISTFLERDLLLWQSFSNTTMRRLWQMLAHLNAQILNYSELGNALGMSSVQIRNYIDLLESTFMVYRLQPYFSNLGKRLIKSPKIYLTDAGITQTLLNINDFNQLTGHPSVGNIWEQIVLMNLKGHFHDSDFYFYRTNHGAECDIVMQYNQKTYAIECKVDYNPKLTKGNFLAFEDINPFKIYIVTTGSDSWSMNDKIEIVSLKKLITTLQSI